MVTNGPQGPQGTGGAAAFCFPLLSRLEPSPPSQHTQGAGWWAAGTLRTRPQETRWALGTQADQAAAGPSETHDPDTCGPRLPWRLGCRSGDKAFSLSPGKCQAGLQGPQALPTGSAVGTQARAPVTQPRPAFQGQSDRALLPTLLSGAPRRCRWRQGGKDEPSPGSGMRARHRGGTGCHPPEPQRPPGQITLPPPPRAGTAWGLAGRADNVSLQMARLGVYLFPLH